MLLLLKRIRFKYFKNSLTAKQTIVKLLFNTTFYKNASLQIGKALKS